MVYAAGAGPKLIPHASINSQNLTEAILYCLTPEATIAARSLSEKMKRESGVKTAVKSFRASLPQKNLQCDLIPDQPAAWTYKKGSKTCKISKLAAGIFSAASTFEQKRLRLYVNILCLHGSTI